MGMKQFLARLCGGSTITINNKTFSGSNISISGNGKVIIDGSPVDVEEGVPLTISINGNVEHLETASGDVSVTGTASTVTTMSGSITCGDVTGSVSSTSGDIECQGNVGGSVKTMSGDVECMDIMGNVNTMSGDITRR